MVMALALADVARQVLVNRTVRLRRSILAAGAALGISLLCQWSSGLFSIPLASATCNGDPDYYPSYSLNLASLLNPCSWSVLYRDRPCVTGGQCEGFAYLGAGGLLLAAWALSRRSRSLRAGRRPSSFPRFRWRWSAWA